MKNVLLLVFIFALNSSVIAQDEMCIIHAKDKMTDKEYYIIKKKLFFESETKQMSVGVSLGRRGEFEGFTVRTKGVGSCNENNKLIFLLEDDSKVTIQSWNDFNCTGTSYFDMYGKYLSKLQKKVKSIMFQNGRTYDSYTVDVPAEDAEYFIKVKSLITSKMYVAGRIEDGDIVVDK